MNTEIKVLMICMDRNLFNPGSVVRERIKMYAQAVGELHIIVFAKSSLGFKNQQIEPNVWIYPTNSFSRWFYPLDAARMGKKIVLKNRFVRGLSLVTTQDPFECGWAGLKIKKKWRIPLEVQMHIDPLFLDGYDRPLDRLRKLIGKRVIAKADSIRVVCGFIKERLERNLNTEGKSINIQPVFIDKDKVVNAPLNFDLHARFGWNFVLLSVARLTPQKDLPTALKALSLVRNKFPDTGLVVVGAGKDEKVLKSLADKLGLKGAVEFVGWQDDMASYYKTANAFLQTSLFEGYGMALVEAGLSGLPVVTTPVGIATELEHGKDAYIYPAGHPELFAEGIIDLIENNHKRENLKMNLKKTLESKLVSKEEYMAKIRDNWEKASKKIK